MLDTSYDREQNHTLRWQKLVESIRQARHRLDERFIAAKDDIVHNQQLFVANKADRLNTLIRKINEQHR